MTSSLVGSEMCIRDRDMCVCVCVRVRLGLRVQLARRGPCPKHREVDFLSCETKACRRCMLEECLVFELPERGYKLKTSERTREKRVKEEEQRGDLETQARLKHLGRQAHQSCPPQTFRDVFK
eukprot:8505298-Prorocentrum_lima.AAC.1